MPLSKVSDKHNSISIMYIDSKERVKFENRIPISYVFSKSLTKCYLWKLTLQKWGMFRSVYNFIIYPSSVSLLLTCSANSVLFWYSIYKMKVSQIHVRVTTFPSNIGSLLPFPHCKCCLYCNLTLIPKGMRAYPCANIGYIGWLLWLRVI